MEVSNCTWTTVLTGVVVKGNCRPVFKMNDGRYLDKIGSFEADAYPLGTRVTITLEEPEPPKERIVLPEGMKWDSFGRLWFYGLLLADVEETGTGRYHRPYDGETYGVERQTQLEAKQTIESKFAEHGYFGVKKVVDDGQ